MQLTRSAVAGFLGLAVYFIFEYVCYWAGRAYAGMSQPIVWMLSANLGGVLVASALERLLQKRLERSGTILAVLAALLGAAASVYAEETVGHDGGLFILGAFLGGLQLPGVLQGFFQVMPRHRQGVLMGLALAAAEMFWIFLLARPEGATEFPLGRYLGVVHLCMGGLAVLRGAWTSEDDKDAPARRSMPSPTESCAPALIRKTILYLMGIGAIFFILDALLDIIFFRYDKVDSPIPREIGLYIWLSYPLIGFMLDKKGFGIKLFLFFLGCCMMSPGLTAMSQSTAMYWVVFSLDIIGRHGAFLFLTIISAHLAAKTSWKGLMRSMPYLLQHASYLGAYCFVEVVHPGTACILLVALFLCCTFSNLALKVQYIVAMSGYADNRVAPPPPPAEPGCEGDAAMGCILTVTRMAWFVEKYGLTSRESDVMGLIMHGMSGQEMSERLFITEYTVKSHIRNILRKTNTASRSALMALFIHEKMGAGDAIEG